jgi:hypothetical protein
MATERNGDRSGSALLVGARIGSTEAGGGMSRLLAAAAAIALLCAISHPAFAQAPGRVDPVPGTAPAATPAPAVTEPATAPEATTEEPAAQPKAKKSTKRRHARHRYGFWGPRYYHSGARFWWPFHQPRYRHHRHHRRYYHGHFLWFRW